MLIWPVINYFCGAACAINTKVTTEAEMTSTIVGTNGKTDNHFLLVDFHAAIARGMMVEIRYRLQRTKNKTCTFRY